MKKGLYGLIDSRSGNFGDVCILDRDEEFRDGFVKLLSDPDIPNYFIEDLVGVRYGTIVYDSDMQYPKFDIPTVPTVIVTGHDIIPRRKIIKRSEAYTIDNRMVMRTVSTRTIFTGKIIPNTFIAKVLTETLKKKLNITLYESRKTIV